MIQAICYLDGYGLGTSSACPVGMQMPEDADLGKISANFKDGVLAVTVQRTQPAQPEVCLHDTTFATVLSPGGDTLAPCFDLAGWMRPASRGMHADRGCKLVGQGAIHVPPHVHFTPESSGLSVTRQKQQMYAHIDIRCATGDGGANRGLDGCCPVGGGGLKGGA